MSRLYVRPPSRTAAETSLQARGPAFRFALVASGKVEHEGVAALAELSASLGNVERVALLVAASDVTLLRLRVPPLSPARLRAALPNLVEEQLISDPAECVMVAGAADAGMRTIAVVQRDWLDTMAKAVAGKGARGITAVPAQLCLPYRAGSVSAAIDHDADDVELTVRLAEQEGIGVAMPPGSSAQDVLETLSAIAREAPVTLYVADAAMNAYRTALERMPELASRLTLARADWSCWLEGVESTGLDLLSGLGVRYGGQDHWRQWRWPAVLAAGLVAINLIGLYADWWRMKHEADTLRAGMVETFKSAYPKETVVLDPIAQTRQKISAARRAAGQLAADDFLVLVSGFGEAWTRAAQGDGGRRPPQVAALEYRDRSLLVRIPDNAEVQSDKLAAGLKSRGLSLAQPAAGTLQVRSAK